MRFLALGLLLQKSRPRFKLRTLEIQKQIFFQIISCLYFRFYSPKSVYAYDQHSPIKVFFVWEWWKMKIVLWAGWIYFRGCVKIFLPFFFLGLEWKIMWKKLWQCPMRMIGVLVGFLCVWLACWNESYAHDWRAGRISMRMIGVLVPFLCLWLA